MDISRNHHRRFNFNYYGLFLQLWDDEVEQVFYLGRKQVTELLFIQALYIAYDLVEPILLLDFVLRLYEDHLLVFYLALNHVGAYTVPEPCGLLVVSHRVSLTLEYVLALSVFFACSWDPVLSFIPSLKSIHFR